MALTVSLPSLRYLHACRCCKSPQWNLAGDLVAAFSGRGPLLYGAEDDRCAHKDNDTTMHPRHLKSHCSSLGARMPGRGLGVEPRSAVMSLEVWSGMSGMPRWV